MCPDDVEHKDTCCAAVRRVVCVCVCVHPAVSAYQHAATQSVSPPTCVLSAACRIVVAGPVHVDHRLVGPVVKASISRAADLGSIPAFCVNLCLDQVVPVT